MPVAPLAVLCGEDDQGSGRREDNHLKTEDLNHTGSHKINNALGQALLAKRVEDPSDRRDRCRTA